MGLGNPLLGDDGVGWRVLDALEDRLVGEPDANADLERVAVGGLGLMERLVGYPRAILVDAVHGLDTDAGTVVCRPLTGLAPRAAAHLDGTHDASLATALAAGRAMGAPLPVEITVVGIEAASLGVFDERLTPEVAEAVPLAVELIVGQLRPAAGDAGDR